MKNKAPAANNMKPHAPDGSGGVPRPVGENGYARLRRYVLRVATSNDDPHFIAIGIAAGVFVGCTPTMPFHTVFAVSLAFLLQGSKAAAALGTWICNPLTFPFLYLGSYKIGDWLLGAMLPFPFRYKWLPEILASGFDTTLLMVTGGIVIGIAPAIVSYFISRKLASAIKAKRARSKKKARLKHAPPISANVDTPC